MKSNNKPASLLSRLASIFRRQSPVQAEPKADNTGAITDSQDDGLHFFRNYSGAHGIQVEEVESDTFVHEWGESVAREVAAHEHELTHTHAPVNRRLPQFDRRKGDRDRRSGDRRNDH